MDLYLVLFNRLRVVCRVLSYTGHSCLSVFCYNLPVGSKVWEMTYLKLSDDKYQWHGEYCVFDDDDDDYLGLPGTMI